MEQSNSHTNKRQSAHTTGSSFAKYFEPAPPSEASHNKSGSRMVLRSHSVGTSKRRSGGAELEEDIQKSVAPPTSSSQTRQGRKSKYGCVN